MVTLKLATTLDGRIATAAGESRWITGPEARRQGHMLRGNHDAILCGIGTVLADDPALTCRIEGLRRTPLVRIVLDTHLRTPIVARLVATAGQTPIWILHRPGADPARHEALAGAGVTLIPVAARGASLDIAAALQALGAAGLTRLLVEGGAGVAAALLQAGLVDRLAWFHAPAIMGADGYPATQSLAAALAQIPRFTRTNTHPLGPDLLTEYETPA